MTNKPNTIPETVQAYLHGEIPEEDFLNKMRIGRQLIDLYTKLDCLVPDKDKKK